MKQIYTIIATLAAVAGVIAALHPTFIPEGGILQALSPFFFGFSSATFAWMAAK